MLSLKRSRKRKRNKAKEDPPAEKSVEEELKEGQQEELEEVQQEAQEVVSPPNARKDLEASARWDNIGEEEEKYLADTYEELYELIMMKGTFFRKVKEKDTETLWRMAKFLIRYGRENVQELQMMQPEEDVKSSPNERSGLGKYTALVSFQQRRTGWMLQEFESRLRGADKELAKKKSEINKLKEENCALRKSVEVIDKERIDLLDRLDSRKVVRRDACVSTEAEVQATESTADRVHPLPRDVSQDVGGTLEALIEKKVGEYFSRVRLP